MTAVAIDSFAYETPGGGEYTRALSLSDGGVSDHVEHDGKAGRGNVDHVVSRRARRKMAFATWLAVEAAARCARVISVEDRVRTPIFFGFPTGVEMTLSFLQSMCEFGDVERERLHERMLGGNAGPIVEYLKYSVGNSPGHVAEHTGLRGPNACFTGFGADLSALRKARLLIEAGVIERAVVVAAEAASEPAEATHAGTGEPSAIGVALLLTARTHHAQPVLLLDETANLSPAPARVDGFEACSCLSNIAWALEQGSASPGTVFRQEDRWGRPMVYGVAREAVACVV